MSKLFLNYLIQRSRKAKAQASDQNSGQTSKGFTLTELLVVVIIGSLIVSSLMTLVVQLVSTEQKESAKTETQREMQLALDYIASDLRQAVYIYDGSPHPVSGATPSYLPYLPAQFADPAYRPVLAFWKPEPLDIQSANLPAYNPGGANPPNPNCNTTYGAELASECNNLWLQRRAYTLVVYFEVDNDQNNPNDIWQGLSRIERYELPKYQNIAAANPQDKFDRNPGFVDPAELGAGGFLNWPFAGDAGNEVNCQAGPIPAEDPCPTRPPRGPEIANSSRSATLVDFVDTSVNSQPGQDNFRVGEPDRCPPGTFTVPNPAGGNDLTLPQYLMMPPSNNGNTSSFFACIRNVQGDTGAAQDIRVYLRGSAEGRSGGLGNSFLPTLESRITIRGIIDRSVN